MSELYSNEPNKLYYTVTLQGDETALNSFDASIRVGNKKGDWGNYTVLETDEENVGRYAYIVPAALIAGYRYAEIKITYDLEEHGIITDTLLFEITKRYISFSDINKILGDEYALSWEQYDLAERDVRLVIESYCLQKFDSWTGEQIVRATNGFIQLPRHLEEIDTIANYVDSSPIPNEPLPISVVNKFELTAAGYAIINESLSKVLTGYDRRPRIRKLAVTGTWGYTSVPNAVRQAAIALFKANMCDDKEYRNRYIDNLRNENVRIEYRDEAFSGDTTGNAFADDILAPYKIFPIGIA